MKNKIYDNDGSKESIKKETILQAHKNIMACGKCKEGYVELADGSMQWCDCIKREFSILANYSDVDVLVPDRDYDMWLKKQKEEFYGEILDKLCVDCNKYFKTNIKGRARCNECFKKYSKEFGEITKVLKDIK